jgi:hypothetical protein
LKEPRLYLEKGCFALGWEWDLVVALNIWQVLNGRMTRPLGGFRAFWHLVVHQKHRLSWRRRIPSTEAAGLSRGWIWSGRGCLACGNENMWEATSGLSQSLEESVGVGLGSGDMRALCW